MRNQNSACFGQTGMAKLAMNAFGILYRQNKLTLGYGRGLVNNDEFRRVAILDVPHRVGAIRLCRVDFGVRWCVEVPNHAFLSVDLCDPELMCEEDISIRHQGRIAYLDST